MKFPDVSKAETARSRSHSKGLNVENSEMEESKYLQVASSIFVWVILVAGTIWI